MHPVRLGAEAHEVDATDGALRVQGGAAGRVGSTCKRDELSTDCLLPGSTEGEGKAVPYLMPHSPGGSTRGQALSGSPLPRGAAASPQRC